MLDQERTVRQGLDGQGATQGVQWRPALTNGPEVLEASLQVAVVAKRLVGERTAAAQRGPVANPRQVLVRHPFDGKLPVRKQRAVIGQGHRVFRRGDLRTAILVPVSHGTAWAPLDDLPYLDLAATIWDAPGLPTADEHSTLAIFAVGRRPRA